VVDIVIMTMFMKTWMVPLANALALLAFYALCLLFNEAALVMTASCE
jgi:hypothetical protein